jgi:hypothetical protein
MAELNFSLLPWQEEVFKDKTRFKVVAAGRRCGKSRLAATTLLIEALRCPAGSGVVQKAVEIALNDEHPSQMAAIKLCMDRMLPVSLFEKEGKQRNAVTINITGIGGSPIEPVIVDEVEDVEAKNE